MCKQQHEYYSSYAEISQSIFTCLSTSRSGLEYHLSSNHNPINHTTTYTNVHLTKLSLFFITTALEGRRIRLPTNSEYTHGFLASEISGQILPVGNAIVGRNAQIATGLFWRKYRHLY